jgi:hypothetical protein
VYAIIAAGRAYADPIRLALWHSVEEGVDPRRSVAMADLMVWASVLDLAGRYLTLG